jgi:RNA polymerase primary sigma factor
MRQLKISKSITNRESQSIEKYLLEIGKEELITAEEEVQLARKIREGDQRALDKLTRANLRFVVSVAKQYQNSALSLNDLINEGNLGLVKAAQKFDETRGFKFISYAVWWIRQSIIQALAEHSRIVRLPLNKVGLVSKINKTFSELEQKYQREATPEEVSIYLGLSIDEVLGALDLAGRHVSMDAPFQEGESNSLIDVLDNPNAELADEGVDYRESLQQETNRTLSTLTERERDVIKLFFGIGVENAMTLEDIGDTLGITRERIRQIKDKAIIKLRSSSRNRALRPYLG